MKTRKRRILSEILKGKNAKQCDRMKPHFTISDLLEGKTAEQREVILKDKLTIQIFVCLYLCPGHCATDTTCPWK